LFKGHRGWIGLSLFASLCCCWGTPSCQWH